MKEKEDDIQSLNQQLSSYDNMLMQLRHKMDKLEQMVSDSVKKKKKK